MPRSTPSLIEVPLSTRKPHGNMNAIVALSRDGDLVEVYATTHAFAERVAASLRQKHPPEEGWSVTVPDPANALKRKVVRGAVTSRGLGHQAVRAAWAFWLSRNGFDADAIAVKMELMLATGEPNTRIVRELIQAGHRMLVDRIDRNIFVPYELPAKAVARVVEALNKAAAMYEQEYRELFNQNRQAEGVQAQVRCRSTQHWASLIESSGRVIVDAPGWRRETLAYEGEGN